LIPRKTRDGETVREKLSALVDGELGSGDVRVHLARLKTDRELHAAWGTYHLIGDALRGYLGPEVVERVSARLREEPTVLAPRAMPVTRVAWYAMSAAAGVAAVALVVWTASPMWSSGPEIAKGPGASKSAVASAARPKSEIAKGPGVAVSAAPQAEAKPLAAPAGVENYLLAHQPFSHTSAMQGIAPYARTVADERGAAGK
jgi:sigma-E factor negative regulatory protein RseA